MLPSNGNGNVAIKYTAKNKVEVVSDGETRLLVDNSGIAVTGDNTITGDVNAAGGFAQSFTLTKLYMPQGGFTSMTASYVSSSLLVGLPALAFTEIPMVRAGSVRGLVLSVLNSTQTIKSGALSASVTINGVNAACTAVGHTGSYIVKTIAKDVVTFTAGQRIGVTVSASALFLSEPDVTSASFMASVLVEM